jgi:hypothetical protein
MQRVRRFFISHRVKGNRASAFSDVPPAPARMSRWPSLDDTLVVEGVVEIELLRCGAVDLVHWCGVPVA